MLSPSARFATYADFEGERQRQRQERDRVLGNDIGEINAAGGPGVQGRTVARQRRFLTDQSGDDAALNEGYGRSYQTPGFFGGQPDAPQVAAPQEPFTRMAAPQSGVERSPAASSWNTPQNMQAQRDAGKIPGTPGYVEPTDMRPFAVQQRAGYISAQAPAAPSFERPATHARSVSLIEHPVVPSAAPAMSNVAKWRGATDEQRDTPAGYASLTAADRSTISSLAPTANQRAAMTPTGGIQAQNGDLVTGRDGKRYRKTMNGYVSGDSFDLPTSYPDSTAEGLANKQRTDDILTGDRNRFAHGQLANSALRAWQGGTSSRAWFDRSGLPHNSFSALPLRPDQYDPNAGEQLLRRRTPSFDA